MIDKKIDVNLKDKYGDTALDLARYFENKELVEYLINCGAKGKEGPSSRAVLWDQIHADFDSANNIKFKSKRNNISRM